MPAQAQRYPLRPAHLRPGAVLGLRYRIVAHLGDGGMGSVYRAEHLGLGKEVALKVLHPALALADREARFEREARAAACLDHPGCIRVLDFGRAADGTRFLAMELVDGPTLAEVLAERGPLEIPHVVRAARELLTALAHAHQQGVLHRDLKPENVMFATRGGARRLVLIDFGLAHLRGAAVLTGAGTCFGSPSYVAPERLLGRDYDARADLYSIGIMMYEMIAGVRPYVGATADEIGRQHIAGEARPLAAIRRDVPPALAALVARAMARNPDDRFADAEDMLASLDGLAAAERAAEVARREELAEDASTVFMAQVVLARPSRMRRLWSWLRYGAWRFPGRAHGSI